jgi:hypothetical protein
MWFSKQFISLLQWRKKVPHKHVASLYQSHTPQMHARKRNLSMHCPCQSFNWNKHIKSSCERCKIEKSLEEQIRISRSARQRAGMTGSELRIDPVQFWFVKWPKVLYNRYLFFIKGFMSTYCKLTIKRWENIDDKSKLTRSSSSNLGITQVLTNLMIVALSIWPTLYKLNSKLSNIAFTNVEVKMSWRNYVKCYLHKYWVEHLVPILSEYIRCYPSSNSKLLNMVKYLECKSNLIRSLSPKMNRMFFNLPNYEYLFITNFNNDFFGQKDIY